MDLKQIMQQAEEMKQKMDGIQKEMKSLRIEGESGGGMVKVEMNGNSEILNIHISDEALQEDKDVLESLIASAVNVTATKVKKEVAEKQKKLLGLPAGINFPL